MNSVPLQSTFPEVAEHVETCSLGVRVCPDCRFARDVEAQSAITVARSEYAEVEAWVLAHPGLCVYCGDDARHMDHLVPKPWTGTIARRFVPKVPACSDCNVRIADAPTFTIAGRAAIVAKSLRQAKAKDLRIPDRDESFYVGMSGRMRDNLMRLQLERQLLRHRLLVLDSPGAPNAPAYMLDAA